MRNKCKKKAAQQAAKKHSASVFLARRCFFRSRRRSATLSLSPGAPARARYRAFYTRARLRLLSLAARETPYGKSIRRRETGEKRTVVVVRRYAEGEKLREKSTLKADENREPTACPSPRNFRTKIVTGTRRRVLVESIPYRARYIYTRRARVIIIVEIKEGRKTI